MSDFDPDAFIEWLADQQGPIPDPVMEEQWPDFPGEYLVGVTGVFVDEEGDVIHDMEEHDGEVYTATYKYDLRRAAKRSYPID